MSNFTHSVFKVNVITSALITSIPGYLSLSIDRILLKIESEEIKFDVLSTIEG